MLEFFLRALRALIHFDNWFGGHDNRLSEMIANEQRERAHNARWSKEFLAEKMAQRRERFPARTSSQGIVLGRAGARRKP
jgi:hypothetical protein